VFPLDNKGAQTQLKAQTASLQLAEQKLSTFQRENLTLADQMLDKHAELCTLKSKLEAVQVEKTHETHLYDLQKRLESELALRKSTESRLQLQNDDFEKKKATLQSELEQLHQQLESTKEELMMAHQSFNEYKLRAQRILQVRIFLSVSISSVKLMKLITFQILSWMFRNFTGI